MARREGKLEALAAQGDELRNALDTRALAEVADLTLRLHQHKARSKGAILPAHMMRSYAERDETERAGMRAACEHVIVALILLGVIDPPEA
jgi:hypothetical protein